MALEAITEKTAFRDTAGGANAEIRTQKQEAGKSGTAKDPAKAPVTITEDAAGEAPGRRDAVRRDEEKEKKAGEPTQKQIKDAVSQANYKMKSTRTGCEFSYHEETNRICIKVYDKDTKEVIREIPPDKILNMVEKMWELAGILVDEKL